MCRIPRSSTERASAAKLSHANERFIRESGDGGGGGGEMRREARQARRSCATRERCEGIRNELRALTRRESRFSRYGLPGRRAPVRPLLRDLYYGNSARTTSRLTFDNNAATSEKAACRGGGAAVAGVATRPGESSLSLSFSQARHTGEPGTPPASSALV